MSIPNESPENQQVNDAITINENGEVVIKDPKLAQAIEELSPEELDAVAGGKLDAVAGIAVLETCTSNKNC
ncbi:type A2 lantipeptide [Nostoc sp. CALU 546]|uniref:type A2 lantipeptide n=1 Tax=Nostoc sp. CALU 546 TaxID=1867241 RepID=UPI003B671E99